MSPSSACLWSRGVRGQSGLRSWLCTCQGQEPVLKKEPRRNQRVRPAGALHRSSARLGGLQQPAPARPTGAVLQDLGRPVQIWVPPCPCPHSSHLAPPLILGSGGVVWRGGGFKSPRVSDRSDRSPNSSPAPVPLRGSERLSGPRFSGSGGISSTSTRPGASLLAETFRLPPHPPRLVSQAQISSPAASLRTQLLALLPSPLVLSPHSQGSGRPNGL